MHRSTAYIFAGASIIALSLTVMRLPAVAEGDEPPQTGPGVTSYYGDTATPANPAWAAEATMTADGSAGAPADAPAPAAEAPADAPATAAADEVLPPQTGPGVTSYYGDAAAPANPAWAAEATMNSDYNADAAVAPAADAPAATVATEEVLPPQTGPGATSYYGDAATPANPAWAAEATMNPDYNAAPSEGPSVARQQQIETCRDALNGEIQSARLMFGSGKWDILPVSYKSLDTIAKIAKDCGDVVIEVDGHTDNQGKPESNVTISLLRAEAVVKYLTRAGVDATRLKAVGLGDTKPVASNDTPQGRQKNRRIEFLVWDKAPQS